ncbi:hypothetical protein L6452_02561 [Arctium lappa]|uniref:Uncharacterized protein n=1 Tax=Arctium lappa TaxID=4217 RepID=A0ACB9FJY6_ARCLA|nr:hypothetical protein L6452_02561 [Arctium lappa]
MESTSSQAFDSDESETFPAKSYDDRDFVNVEFSESTDLDPNKVPWRGSGKNSISQDEKDKRIKELTLELYNEKQRSKRRCAAYQEQVCMLLKFIDEHTDNLSKSVQDIIHNIRTLEKEQLKDSD